MTIRIYDSMSHEVVPLRTRDEGRIGIYACGPTVYNYIHIGNARTVVWFDFIRSYLTYRGYDVTFVMNYTDVDDRIIERAALENISPEAVAKKYEDAFEQDMGALGFRPPDVLCRATEHIDDMVKAIEGLIDNGVAYEVGGDVFFAVERFPGYGKLSRRSLDDMRARERIEPHPGKRHPVDFALWKSAKEQEPSWPSPWGPGRPGWHIECSVMSTKYLGAGFDIHGGGSDLVFPHHENEIAQAEALTGEGSFARQWLHTGMVQMETEKMSKSLGNVVLARDVVERYSGEVVRYWCLMGSYRAQPTFSSETLADASRSYERWKTFYDAARHLLGDAFPARPDAPRRPEGEAVGDPHLAAFVAAMDEDFNSARALAVTHELVHEGNRHLRAAEGGDASARAAVVATATTFLEICAVLGFSFAASIEMSGLAGRLIDLLVELRDRARAEKAYERADEIRRRLVDLGVHIEDTPAGTRWRVGGA